MKIQLIYNINTLCKYKNVQTFVAVYTIIIHRDSSTFPRAIARVRTNCQQQLGGNKEVK